MRRQRSLDVQVGKLRTKSPKGRRAGRRVRAERRGIAKADARWGQALYRLDPLAREGEQASSRWFGEAIALHPDDPEALNNLAGPCLDEGKLEQALGHYRRLAHLCPLSAKAHTSLALTEERIGNLRAAADSYRRALALDPGSPDVHCKLAIILNQLDALPEALWLSEHAVTLEPGRFETYNTLGIVLTDTENRVAATEAFWRSLTLNRTLR